MLDVVSGIFAELAEVVPVVEVILPPSSSL